jgi:hypothetical protein
MVLIELAVGLLAIRNKQLKKEILFSYVVP